MTRLDRKSDAQANAEALARRSSTYADEHARSWTVAFDRPSHEPKSLREYVRVLRKAYADEVPQRLHSRETDGGGDPAWSPEFTRYLTAYESGTDVDGTYLTPFRACYWSMRQSTDEATRRRASIVARSIVGGEGPVESAIEEGVPDWCAKIVARDAHQVFWRRLSDVRLDLRPVAKEPAAA